MNEHGWVVALIALALFVLMILPLTLTMGASAGDAVNSKKEGQSLKQALYEAKQHRGFWLLVLGFFTCGFQVQYINSHLPAYLTDMQLDPIIGATAISVISLFNMIGRIFWASSSDYIGRKNTYWIFFAVGIILYCSIPYTAQQVSVNPSIVWLVYFYAATMLIFTMWIHVKYISIWILVQRNQP